MRERGDIMNGSERCRMVAEISSQTLYYAMRRLQVPLAL